MSKISTEEAFRSFLKTLGAEESDAAEKYVELRERLERFFEWRDCESVEDLADIVFDRTIKKIIEGEKIENAEAYCFSVSKFVLLENRRESLRKVQFDENLRQTAHGIGTESNDDELKRKRFSCLDRCLTEFPVDIRSLLIRYFETDERTMISSRRTLADALGINLNSLRIRISRLKAKLEKCTRDCCAEEQTI